MYGEKTSSAYNFLINELLHGSFPILTYIDPLQSAYTGIYAKPKITKQGQIFSQIFAEGTEWPIFRVDFHPIGGGNPVPHINAGAINGASARLKHLTTKKYQKKSIIYSKILMIRPKSLKLEERFHWSPALLRLLAVCLAALHWVF